MTASTTTVFLDTNILVYANDRSSGDKCQVAQSLVTDLWDSGGGCVSVQVLQELFVTLTRKLPVPLGSGAASLLVSDLSRWQVHAPNARDVIEAIDAHRRLGVSFWDAMVLRSAGAMGCAILYSEDLNPGQVYDGVQVLDPFR